MNADGDLMWEEKKADGNIVQSSEEPGTNFLSRFVLSALGLLPIEWLL